MLSVRDTRGAVHPIPLSRSDSVSLTFASLSFCLFTCPYLFWHFVRLLQPLPSLTTSFITSSGVPRMQKSRSPVLRTPELPKLHSFKSDSATVEVGMFQLVPGALPYHYFYFLLRSYRFIHPHFLIPIPNSV